MNRQLSTTKAFLAAMLLMLLLAPVAWADGVKVQTGKGVVGVTFYADDIVRITKTTTDGAAMQKSLAVTMTPANVKVTRRDDDGMVSVGSRKLTVSVDSRTGRVTFTAKDGGALLAEKDFSLEAITGGADAGGFRVNQSFTLGADEPIYGLGILQDGKMNRRGTHRYVMQSNLEDYQNVIQSIKGWGLFWDNYSPTNFDDDENGMQFRSEVGDGVDYYFMYGGSLDKTTALMRTLSGRVPMMPLWSYGFFQSKERYKSLDETVGVVRKYRELGIPLDCIVQDWQYWGSHYLWNAMEFLGEGFGNAQGYIDDIHRQDAKLMITIWSSFGPQTKGYRELAARNRLFNFQTWPQSGIESQWPPRMDYPSGVCCYDPYATESRDIYWQNLQRLHKMGVDGWWMDSTEPDNVDMTAADFDTKVGDTRTATFRRLRNAYPLATVGGVHDHQLATDSSKRVFIMTRSGFAGQQRYAANVWSGDVGSSWESLRAQIPAGLNFTLTGNPNYNSDGGGFFAGAYNKTWNDGSGARNPLYRELYVRWMQYAMFCPVMRSHGTEVPREFYYYGTAGEPVYDALVDAVKLRYRLLPYIYSTAWQVTKNDDSHMRPLSAEFPDDRRTWDMAHEFMFGRNILAAPVVYAQYTPEKIVKTDEMSGWDKKDNADSGADISVDFSEQKTAKVYLPTDGNTPAVWYDFNTGKRYAGGQDITMTTTIGTIPMFVRAGGIVPVGREMQSTATRDWSELELRVYPGTDGSFTLYEDEGDGYGYERGERMEILLTWSDARRTLTIGQRRGTYPSMPQKRSFTVKLPDGTSRTVAYTGKKVSVKM